MFSLKESVNNSECVLYTHYELRQVCPKFVPHPKTKNQTSKRAQSEALVSLNPGIKSQCCPNTNLQQGLRGKLFNFFQFEGNGSIFCILEHF